MLFFNKVPWSVNSNPYRYLWLTESLGVEWESLNESLKMNNTQRWARVKCPGSSQRTTKSSWLCVTTAVIRPEREKQQCGSPKTSKILSEQQVWAGFNPKHSFLSTEDAKHAAGENVKTSKGNHFGIVIDSFIDWFKWADLLQLLHFSKHNLHLHCVFNRFCTTTLLNQKLHGTLSIFK